MVVTQASCSLGSERRCSAFLAPVTAAAGSLDHDYVAVFDLPADLGWQLFVVQKVAADLARFSAFEAARAMAPAVREQGEACWCKDSYGADEAVATAVFSSSKASVGVLSVLLIPTWTPEGPGPFSLAPCPPPMVS